MWNFAVCSVQSSIWFSLVTLLCSFLVRFYFYFCFNFFFGSIKICYSSSRSSTAEEDWCSCFLSRLHFCCIWKQHCCLQACASGSAHIALSVLFLRCIWGVLSNICYLFQVATWSSHSAKVKLLLLFGDHIVSIDAHGNMFLWAFKGIDQNLVPFGHIVLDGKFSPSCIMHPDTYLNKVNISFSILRIHRYCIC